MTVLDLRRLFRESQIVRGNLVFDDGRGNIDDMTELCIELEQHSVSDWQFREHIVPLLDVDPDDAPVVVTEDKFQEEFRDDITGEIEWDSIRDRLHEEMYADEYDTKIKAGNAVGVIRRFLFEVSVGDVCLLNTSRGTAIARYTGEPIYDPEQDQADIDPAHVFRRSIEFVRDDDGEIPFFESSELPDPLKPNRLTVTKVDREDLQTLLTHAESLETLAKAADDSTSN